MNFIRNRSAAARRSAPAASLQQRVEPADTRQQQQDNGTHEFQPLQQGDNGAAADGPQTLQAYLRLAGLRGELPRAANAPGHAELHVAK